MTNSRLLTKAEKLLGEAAQLSLDIQSWNQNHPESEPIHFAIEQQIVHDLRGFVQQMKMNLDESSE